MEELRGFIPPKAVNSSDIKYTVPVSIQILCREVLAKRLCPANGLQFIWIRVVELSDYRKQALDFTFCDTEREKLVSIVRVCGWSMMLRAQEELKYDVISERNASGMKETMERRGNQTEITREFVEDENWKSDETGRNNSRIENHHEVIDWNMRMGR